MTFWQFLNHWWNLPYLVMLGLVGVFFALQAVGLVTHGNDGEADADHDVDHEVDHDVDHDVHVEHEAAVEHDLDHDVHVEHEADHAVDHDADHDGDHDAGGEGPLQALFAFLGVGRVPFLVVWLTLFIFTGFTGLILNLLVGKAGLSPAVAFPATLGGSLLTGGLATRLCARLVGRIVDVGGKGATSRRELQGRVGVVASASVDREFGEVRVHDEHGQEILVHGRVEGPALEQGQRVVLLELDRESGLYVVEKLEPEEGANKE